MAGEESCVRLPDSELSRIMRSNLHMHVRENSWVKSEENGIGKLRVLRCRSSPRGVVWGWLGAHLFKMALLMAQCGHMPTSKPASTGGIYYPISAVVRGLGSKLFKSGADLEGRGSVPIEQREDIEF